MLFVSMLKYDPCPFVFPFAEAAAAARPAGLSSVRPCAQRKPESCERKFASVFELMATVLSGWASEVDKGDGYCTAHGRRL